MPSDARAILTAAAHVLDSFERGDFPPPDPVSGVSSIEWDDGYAALEDGGTIRVTIPNGNRTVDFRLCPISGQVHRGRA